MTQAIFLSYASQDADAARRICDALRAQGLEVWFDQSELRGGDAWDQSIRKQIKECALFVPVISANTNARAEGYFRLEWKLAVDRSHLIADDQPFFVPVVLGDTAEPTARVPEAFRTRQWTRIGGDAAMAAFAARVVKLVGGSRRQGKNTPEAAPNSEVEIQSDTHKPVAPDLFRGPMSVPTSQQQNLGPGTSPGRQADSPAYLNTTSPNVSKGRRPLLIAAISIALVLAFAAGTYAWKRERNQAFIAQSLTQIESLARSTKYMEAYRLAGDVERAGGADQLTETIRETYSRNVDVTSTPKGAAIAFREYKPKTHDTAWIELGAAPLTKQRVPRGVLEWRATLPQREAHVLTANTFNNAKFLFTLSAAGDKQAGMVNVPAAETRVGRIFGVTAAQKVKLAAFAIDRTEVTNRQFAAFVKAGGYVRAEFWKHQFQDGAKTLAFDDAMARFKDATGRTGPASWKLGSFPDGEAGLPVRGVSWYEASAYAEFAGKSLPTLYHWYFADTGDDTFFMPPAVMPSANFEGKAPRTSMASRTVTRFGAFDMAGNVREWVANATVKGRRLALGGSWQEVAYQYRYATPFSAWDRPADVGFRCMSRIEETKDDVAFSPLVESSWSDAKTLAKVSDAEYAIYARMLAPAKVALDSRIEATDATPPYWTRIKVSFAASYGGERMNAYLYLPKNAAPPFQTVIYYPGSNAFGNDKSFDAAGETVGGFQPVEILVRGGRAVLYPIWKGSFERSEPDRWTNTYFRETLPRWAGDMRQSLEFLRGRSDVDADRIGFFGFSQGALYGAPLLAMEPRVKASVMLAGGLDTADASGALIPPEVSVATYAPRVRIPVLMVNGREDIRFPYETSQMPYFNLFASPPGMKKHKTFPGGHGVLGFYDDLVRETHDWLDTHLGPVRAGSGK